MIQSVPIQGHEKYLVNTVGKVFSTKRDTKGRELTPYTAFNGYRTVSISNKTQYIHRLVAQAFIPNPENKKEVNHIDGDKTNNCVSNLEWVTHAENMTHASNNNLMLVGSTKQAGTNNGRAKLSNKTVCTIRSKYQTGKYTQKQLGDMYGVSQVMIGNIVRGDNWKISM